MLKIQNKKRKLAAGAFAAKKPSASEVKRTKINEIKALIDLQLETVVFSVNNTFNILVNITLHITCLMLTFSFAVFMVRTEMLQKI